MGRPEALLSSAKLCPGTEVQNKVRGTPCVGTPCVCVRYNDHCTFWIAKMVIYRCNRYRSYL